MNKLIVAENTLKPKASMYISQAFTSKRKTKKKKKQVKQVGKVVAKMDKKDKNGKFHFGH